MQFPLGQVIRAGFHQNPLVLDICSIIETRALQDLKWRARVRLPTGVFLIGIADETGTLEEGQVFCQYQEADDTKPVIVESEVIVCRAPARELCPECTSPLTAQYTRGMCVEPSRSTILCCII